MGWVRLLISVVASCSITGSSQAQPTPDGTDVGRVDTAAQGVLPAIKPEDRLYTFRLVDVEYREILEDFARQSGLKLTGDPQAGRASFDCGREPMSFKLAFNRLNVLLFGGTDPHFVQRTDDGLEVRPMPWDVDPRYSGIRGFLKHKEFLRADVPDDEWVFVVFRQPGGLGDEQRTMRRYVPDYVRVSPLEERDALVFFGVAMDVRRYLALADMLGRSEDFAVKRFRFDDAQVGEAVRRLHETLVDAAEHPAMRADRPSGPQQDLVEEGRDARRTDAGIWIDELHGEIIVKCPYDQMENVDKAMAGLGTPIP